MKFTKMHGLGNDYVYVECLRQPSPPDPAALARQMSNRHFGIGSDGLILIEPGRDGADFTMRMFNADGSEGAMCGNGIRCVGKYVYDRGLTRKTDLRIMTAAGLRTLNLIPDGHGRVSSVAVDMGEPILEPARIPVRHDGPRVFDLPLSIEDRTFKITCLSVGNPHCVIPVDDLEKFPIERFGTAIERHPLFPDRINVEFVKRLGPSELQVRVWERGSGETQACGTGACAVLAASALHGWTGREATIRLRGGDLSVRWGSDNRLWMTGPAVEVYEGTLTSIPQTPSLAPWSSR
jgi:diaminopimelate epimerase